MPWTRGSKTSNPSPSRPSPSRSTPRCALGRDDADASSSRLQVVPRGNSSKEQPTEIMMSTRLVPQESCSTSTPDGIAEPGAPASCAKGAKPGKQVTEEAEEDKRGVDIGATSSAPQDNPSRKRPADSSSADGEAASGRQREGCRSASSSATGGREHPRPKKVSRHEPYPSRGDGGQVGGCAARGELESGLGKGPNPWLSGPCVARGEEGGKGGFVQNAPNCVSGMLPPRKQTFYFHMGVMEKWNKLKIVLKKEELPAMVNLMMAEEPLKALRDALTGQIGPFATLATKESNAKTGSAAERGFVLGAMTVFSHSVIGEHKLRYSGFTRPTSTNNAFFAAARQLWPGDTTSNFEAAFIKSLSSTRSEMHYDTRKGLVAFVTVALNHAARRHFTANGDILLDVSGIYSHAQDVIKLLVEDDMRLSTLMDAVFYRCIKAHRSKHKHRAALSTGDIFGEETLLRDFSCEVAAPLLRWALPDMEYSEVTPQNGESPLDEAVRRAETWGKLQLGGFTDNTSRKFQTRMWGAIFAFCTGKRRHAHRLLHTKPEDLDGMVASIYITPYLHNLGDNQGGDTASSSPAAAMTQKAGT